MATTPPWLIYVLAGLGLIVVLTPLYLRYQHNRARLKLRERMQCGAAKILPTQGLIFGLDLIWEHLQHLKKHTLLRWKTDIFESFNTDTIEAHFMGKTMFFTIEPENLKWILSTNFKSWGVGADRKVGLGPFLGDGIFTSDGEEWQQSRALLRPCFARSQIGDNKILEKHFQNLIKALPTDSSTVDLESYFFSFTLDVATEFLFGASTNCLTSTTPLARTEDFVKAFSYCQNPFGEGTSGISDLLRVFLPSSKFKKSCKIVKSYGDYLVEQGSARLDEDEPDRYVFLRELKSQISDKTKIRDELLNILLAGRDTTASLLVNVFFELARRPDICQRLRDEIGTLDCDYPTFEQLKNMKYLRAVLNESLRLYPVVPEDDRQALSDTVLPRGGGSDGMSPIAVMKGDYVSWSTFAMHRRRDIYGEDAELFRPERWLDNGSQKGLRVTWEYLPFNGGPRICLGR